MSAFFLQDFLAYSIQAVKAN